MVARRLLMRSRVSSRPCARALVLLVPPVLWCAGATRAAGAAGASAGFAAAASTGFVAFSTSSFVTRGPEVGTDAMSTLPSEPSEMLTASAHALGQGDSGAG